MVKQSRMLRRLFLVAIICVRSRMSAVCAAETGAGGPMLLSTAAECIVWQSICRVDWTS